MNLYPNFDSTNIINIEELAEVVHKAYCEEYKRQKGEPYWTNGDYSLLDEDTKEFDRATVHAVVQALFPAPVPTEGES